MATTTYKGKAQFNGAAATFDVILYPVQQSMKATHRFDEEIIKDAVGQDASWRGQNEQIHGSLEMKLLGDTAAHAQAGAAFLAPLSTVTISACLCAMWNTTWQIVPDSDIGLKNDAVGDVSYRLRRYVDATQNTLAGTTPS